MRIFFLVCLLMLASCKIDAEIVDSNPQPENLYKIVDADSATFLLDARNGRVWRLVSVRDDVGDLYSTYWSPMDIYQTAAGEYIGAIEPLADHNAELKAPKKPAQTD